MKSKQNKKLPLLLLSGLLVLTILPFSFVFVAADGDEKNPVLFVHGWTESASSWDDMIDALVEKGWSRDLLYAYTFDSRIAWLSGTNVKNAQEIKDWVDDILEETGAEKIDLVSHSMGGLSTRYYVKFLGGIDLVDDYVSLGSPHHGATLAYIVRGDMKPGSDFLEELNSGDETPGGILPDSGTHVPGDIEYVSIYSDSDELVWGDSAVLDGALNINTGNLDGVDHLALLDDEIVINMVASYIS